MNNPIFIQHGRIPPGETKTGIAVDKMSDIFISAKIRPPRISGILKRRRLLDDLFSHNEKKLIVIMGQAAQGKSTLAASFVRTCPDPFAWVNLGAEESNPVNLFRVIVQAIQHAFPQSDFSGIYRYIAMDLGPRLEEPLYHGWVNALFRIVPSRIQIVLDGLERLSPSTPSFRLIRILIEESHTKMRFLVLSRTEPPWDVRNMQIKQEAILIVNEQLAFTASETENFFHVLHNLHLPAAQLMRIHELTEGWIGGLLLFSEALNPTTSLNLLRTTCGAIKTIKHNILYLNF